MVHRLQAFGNKSQSKRLFSRRYLTKVNVQKEENQGSRNRNPCDLVDSDDSSADVPQINSRDPSSSPIDSTDNSEDSLGERPEAPSVIETSRLDKLQTKTMVLGDNVSDLLVHDESYRRDIALQNRLKALECQQRLYGEAHPDVLFSLRNLGCTLYRRGEYTQAQRIFAEKARRVDKLFREEREIPQEITINNP